MMTTPGIDTVIFDIGRVLVDFDPARYVEQEVPDVELQRRIYPIMFKNPDWEADDLGIYSEEEILGRFIRKAPDLEEEIRKLYDRSGGTITLFPYAVPWVLGLKDAGFRVYALSNYSRHLYERTVEKMKFLPLLDGVVFSWQCHSIKPDGEIYRCLFRQYQINPSRAVFLDDNLPNIEKARELGMYAIHFTGFEEAKTQLDSLLGI